MSALSGETGDKSKCSFCHKSHYGACNKPKNAAALNQGSENLCPVCNKSAHKYKTKTGADGISKCVKNCPAFKAANDDQKQEMVKKLMSKFQSVLSDPPGVTSQKPAIGNKIAANVTRFTSMTCAISRNSFLLFVSQQGILYDESSGYSHQELLNQSPCHV